MADVLRGAAAVAGLAVIAVVTLYDFREDQFFLWLAACTLGAALVIWGVKGLFARRRPAPRDD
ncbi:hypothetical protein [Cellulomonas triticagri]|uniref:DUF2530 domain-containing protein n=1 Tax=Cellulomonas triticagri TaxID=2483352 RepID=A0A3M2JJP4_9CELL|nr:hypothetical protein [Cellulomonas triticagri]RMI13334.1 hypothetical protein EBM89_04835 [Cellulomonas triticagri]